MNTTPGVSDAPRFPLTAPCGRCCERIADSPGMPPTICLVYLYLCLKQGEEICHVSCRDTFILPRCCIDTLGKQQAVKGCPFFQPTPITGSPKRPGTAPAVQTKFKRLNNILMHALSIEGCWFFSPPPSCFPFDGYKWRGCHLLAQLQGQVFGEGREDEGDDFIRNLKEGIKQ